VRPITNQASRSIRVHHAQLVGKLARLLEELREHGGNGRSVYAEGLRSEIEATRSELEGLAVHVNLDCINDDSEKGTRPGLA